MTKRDYEYLINGIDPKPYDTHSSGNRLLAEIKQYKKLKRKIAVWSFLAVIHLAATIYWHDPLLALISIVFALAAHKNFTKWQETYA